MTNAQSFRSCNIVCLIKVRGVKCRRLSVAGNNQRLSPVDFVGREKRFSHVYKLKFNGRRWDNLQVTYLTYLGVDLFSSDLKIVTVTTTTTTTSKSFQLLSSSSISISISTWPLLRIKQPYQGPLFLQRFPVEPGVCPGEYYDSSINNSKQFYNSIPFYLKATYAMNC